MKKMILVMAVLLCGAVLVSAQGQEKAAAPADQPEKKPLDQWTFFQLGFFPGFPDGTKNSNVYGFKLGAPMETGYGRVNGLEASVLYSGTEYVKGAQATMAGPAIGKEIHGVQASWTGPTIARTVYGLQASCTLNMADEVIGFEPGLANITKSLTGFQASAVNISEKTTGFQAGAVNISDKTIGFQMSAVNMANELKGFQLGVFNYSKKSGCQLGLINIIEDGSLPFMIIFNIKF